MDENYDLLSSGFLDLLSFLVGVFLDPSFSFPLDTSLPFDLDLDADFSDFLSSSFFTLLSLSLLFLLFSSLLFSFFILIQIQVIVITIIQRSKLFRSPEIGHKFMLHNHPVPASVQSLEHSHQIMHIEMQTCPCKKFLQLLVVNEPSLLSVYEIEQVFRLLTSELMTYLQDLQLALKTYLHDLCHKVMNLIIQSWWWAIGAFFVFCPHHLTKFGQSQPRFVTLSISLDQKLKVLGSVLYFSSSPSIILQEIFSSSYPPTSSIDDLKQFEVIESMMCQFEFEFFQSSGYRDEDRNKLNQQIFGRQSIPNSFFFRRFHKVVITDWLRSIGQSFLLPPRDRLRRFLIIRSQFFLLRLLILQIVKISFDFLLTYILSKFLQDILFIFLFVEFVLVFFLWHKDFLWSRLLIFLMVTFLWCLLHCFYEFLKMLDQYITVFQAQLTAQIQKMAVFDTHKCSHKISQFQTCNTSIVIFTVTGLLFSCFFNRKENFFQFLLWNSLKTITFLGLEFSDQTDLLFQKQKKGSLCRLWSPIFLKFGISLQMKIVDLPQNSRVKRIDKLQKISILPALLSRLNLHDDFDFCLLCLFFIIFQKLNQMFFLDDCPIFGQMLEQCHRAEEWVGGQDLSDALLNLFPFREGQEKDRKHLIHLSVIVFAHLFVMIIILMKIQKFIFYQCLEIARFSLFIYPDKLTFSLTRSRSPSISPAFFLAIAYISRYRSLVS